MKDCKTDAAKWGWDMLAAEVASGETEYLYSDRYWLHVFAGQAMQAILGANPIMCSHTDDTLPGLAVHVAESLLAELRKPGKGVQDEREQTMD